MTDKAKLLELAERVPVISLWQPWASLIFSGDKLHETRAYRPPAKYIGQRIAIHATKTLRRDTCVSLHLICERAFGGMDWDKRLPLGAVIGTVRLVQAYETDEPFINTSVVDRICGDWSKGRYAWLLKDAEMLPEPLPAKGKQGWWGIEAAALRAIAENG